MFLHLLALRQLSPEPGMGGGNDLPLTLDDMDDETPEPKKEGEPETPLGDIDDKPEPVKEPAKEPEKEPVKTPEIPKVDPVKEPETPETPEDDEEEEDNFWDEVDALRGESLDVDYGEVDPMTPEGALIRERAVESAAVSSYEAMLEEKYPKAYAYLLHTSEGGTDEQFFQQVGTDELPTDEQLENDTALQKSIVIKGLTTRGNSEKQINAIIKQAVEDDDLPEMAKDELVAQRKIYNQTLEEVKNSALAEQENKKKALGQMTTYVDQVVQTGVIDNIQIPEADRAAFAKEFGQKIRYDGQTGKFMLVTELSDENMAAVFKKEFFDFKKGDLDALVKRQARTENSKRLKNTLHTSKTTKSTTPINNSGNSLGDVE